MTGKLTDEKLAEWEAARDRIAAVVAYYRGNSAHVALSALRTIIEAHDTAIAEIHRLRGERDEARSFGPSPLEKERIRSALIEGLEKAYWAGSEVASGFDAVKEAESILAKLEERG